jgi:hypothetical protein
MRTLPLLLLTGILSAGCASSQPAPATPPSGTGGAAMAEMKSKMETMTPEARAQYAREHPEEFANLGRVDVPSANGTPAQP